MTTELKTKSAEVADRILEVGSHLFRQYGVRAITMDEIANKVGMSKKTLYAYFGDKDALVTSAIERYTHHLQTSCEMISSQSHDAVEEMIQIMYFLDGTFRNMNPVVLLELERFHPSAFKVFLRYKEEYITRSIRENLLRGIREAVYRSEIDIEIISRYRMESSMLCFHQEVFPKDRFEMSRVQVELTEHYLYGITSLKGRKLIEKYKQKMLDQNHKRAL